jgi:hypothetical protein
MNRKAKYKVAWFIVLLALYFVAAGSDVTVRMNWRLMLVYVTGAAVAFWAGGEPIGTFRPITMRPLCILIGSLFMIWAFTMTLFVREALHKGDRAPGQMKTSAVALQFQSGVLNQVHAPRDPITTPFLSLVVNLLRT